MEGPPCPRTPGNVVRATVFLCVGAAVGAAAAAVCRRAAVPLAFFLVALQDDE